MPNFEGYDSINVQKEHKEELETVKKENMRKTFYGAKEIRVFYIRKERPKRRN